MDLGKWLSFLTSKSINMYIHTYMTGLEIQPLVFRFSLWVGLCVLAATVASKVVIVKNSSFQKAL